MTRSRSSALLLLALPLAGLVPPDAPPGNAGIAGLRAEQPLVTNAIIPEPLGTERASLYLTLRSRETFDDELLAIEVEGVEHVTLHLTRLDGGVARMREVESVPLPAGGEIQLRPGSLHAMLERLDTEWEAGEAVALTLRFRRAGEIQARARVVPFSELDTAFE